MPKLHGRDAEKKWVDLTGSGSGGAGTPGKDGYSPTAKVEQTEDGAVVTITDKSGTTTAELSNGKDGAPGQNGVGIELFAQTATSLEDGGINQITVILSNGVTSLIDVRNGRKGSDANVTAANIAAALGYTPVAPSKISLGIHTDGLIYVFVDGVPVGNGIEMIAGSDGDVIGYVDSENNIVVKGDLADGEYSVKYEMADGTVIDIGDLVLDSNVYYSVTNNLTNCTTSNSATHVTAGQAYAATITPDSGYELKSVTVTMGGSPVTVSGGSISIANVTGDIVITAVAEEVQAAEPVTVDIALTDGIRIGSDGGDRTLAGYCATPHIDLTGIPKPCVINLTKALWCYNESSTMSTVRTYAVNSSGTVLVNGATKESLSNQYITVAINESTGGTTANDGGKDVSVTVTSDDVATIRFSGMWTTGSDSQESFAKANTKATLTYTPES